MSIIHELRECDYLEAPALQLWQHYLQCCYGPRPVVQYQYVPRGRLPQQVIGIHPRGPHHRVVGVHAPQGHRVAHPLDAVDHPFVVEPRPGAEPPSARGPWEGEEGLRLLDVLAERGRVEPHRRDVLVPVVPELVPLPHQLLEELPLRVAPLHKAPNHKESRLGLVFPQQLRNPARVDGGGVVDGEAYHVPLAGLVPEEDLVLREGGEHIDEGVRGHVGCV
uniref:Uncharacterized protein n=1 Tax=Arcella intermedia TaxID=1963864 RepID=A0A6B2LHR6_9EUKA